MPLQLDVKTASTNQKIFNFSKENDHWDVKKTFKKKPGQKNPWFSVLFYNTNALKKHNIRKNEEEAEEYAKLLSKRINETKEKHREKLCDTLAALSGSFYFQV